MSFALNPLAAPDAEIRRLLIEQTQGAVDALANEDILSGLFRARKSIRRARSMLRLARGGMRDVPHRTLRNGLRDSARMLSAPRDAAVVHQLMERHSDVLSVRTLPVVVDSTVIHDARHRLQQLLPLLAETPFETTTRDVLKGFTRGYRSARRAMVIARSELSDENLHAWRKRVKTLRHHLQVLTPLWPALLDTLTTEAAQLQSALGKHRDLMLLSQQVGELPPQLKSAQRQCEQDAFTRGSRLLAAQDRLVGAWLRSLWEQQSLEHW